MITKFLLGSIAIGALATSAFAADLPSRRAPPVFVPPPIPVFSWTGFYLGGQLGFGFGQDRGTLNIGPFSATNDVGQPNGIIGGAHVGYNFSTQTLGGPALGPLGGAGGLIVGVEADINGTDWRGFFGTAGFPASPGAVSIRKDIEGSVRGRIGFAVDRALFYATGGAAFTQFHTSYLGGALRFANSRVGYTVGGGAEYAITTQISLRAEYRYADFGTFRDVIIPNLVSVTHRPIQQQVQVGFSYKFDTAPAPVVARY